MKFMQVVDNFRGNILICDIWQTFLNNDLERST